MKKLDPNLTRTTYWLASAIAGLIALSLPLGFFTLALESNLAAMNEEAKYNAANLSRLITGNPESWQLDAPQLNDLIKDLTDTGLPELRRIVDATGRVVVQSFESTASADGSQASQALDPLNALSIMRTANLMRSGNVVGQFQVIRNVRSLLLGTVLVSLLGLFLGAMVLAVLRIYPLRALKATLAALANEKERAEVTLHSIGDAVVTIDGQGTVQSFNPAAKKMFGYTAAEVVGRNIKMLMPQAYHSKFDNYLQRHPDTGEAYLFGVEREVMAQRSGGETFAADLRISEFYLDGRRQLIGTMRDITERNGARDEILRLNASLEMRVEKRTAQLKFANEQLEAFSYSVSHDLRNPLSTIDLISTVLERSLPKSDDSPSTKLSRHHLARIRAGVGQMVELIEGLLSLAQVSRASLHWETVDLSFQAEAILLGFQEREPGRAVQLQVEPGLLAEGDPRLLRQVLDNLLGNAWKFSAGQACTCIAFGRQTGSADETVYFVRDSGVGFDMAYAPKLFAAFQRLHTQSEFAGTGIGLATVQRIIALHGGQVCAEAALGQGATFYFTLGVPSAAITADTQF